MIVLLVLTFGAPDVKAEARGAFETGTAALSTGRFADAISSFERCLALDSRPPCAFNLAVAYRGTGDVLAAERVLEALLAGQWGRVRRTRKKQVNALLEETRSQVAVLKVELPNAVVPTLRIDGEIVGVDEEIRVNPGNHALLATAERYRDLERTVSLEPGARKTLSLALEPVPGATRGTLIVETTSATDRIEVEGVGVSVGHYNSTLEAGSYRLRVSGDGEVREQGIEIEPGATLKVSIDLRDGASVLSSPWFWAGTALIAAGSVGAVLFFTREEAPPLVEDDRFGVIEALRP